MIVLTGLGPECSAIHLRQVFRGDAVLPRFRGGGEQRFHGLAGSLVVGIQLFLPAFTFLRPEMGIGGTNRKPEDTKSDQKNRMLVVVSSDMDIEISIMAIFLSWRMEIAADYRPLWHCKRDLSLLFCLRAGLYAPPKWGCEPQLL